MQASEATVFLIDDSADARNAAAALLSSLRIPCQSFSSAEEFLPRYDPLLTGCIVADARLGGMSGLDLLEWLASRENTLPVIIISGYADVPMTVRAMQQGALTVLEKPYPADELVDAIRAAFRIHVEVRRTHTERTEIRWRLDSLTPRERRLAELLSEGTANKRMARLLGISQRTVERLRSKVLEKMSVESAPQLATVLSTAGLRESLAEKAV